MIFGKQIDFVERFDRVLFDAFKKAIEAHGLEMKDYVINQQLYNQGIDGMGQPLMGYTRTTIRLKIAKGQPADRTTLKDEGLFYASIEIKAFSDAFAITSNVAYDHNLLKRYGRDVLKLTSENLKEFMENYLIPNLKNYVNN